MLNFALTFLLATAGPQDQMLVSGQGAFTVVVAETTEGRQATIRANEAPALDVLRKLAGDLGRELEGLDAIGELPPITVHLDNRPAETALHWVAGAAGVRARVRSEAILLMSDTSPFPTKTEFFNIAETSFQRALVRYPDSPDSAAAEMRRAEIQEHRGALSAAIKLYDSVIRFHFASAEVPDAMLRSAELLVAEKQYESAATRLEELATLERPHPHHAEARLQLAECLTLSGRPGKALYTLRALDSNYPTEDPDEIGRRQLAHAHALAINGEGVEALRLLDAVQKSPDAPQQRLQELRSIALEASGRLGEAAVGWLRFGETGGPAVQERAAREAARLSLLADDQLGAIFIHRWAEERGIGDAVLDYANEARTQLGLTPHSLIDLTDSQRIERARQLSKEGMHADAARSLEPLFRRRSELSQETMLEVSLTYAKALDASGLEQDAIDVLRTSAPLLERREARNRIFILASELHEKHGRIEDALDAVQGRL